VDSFLQCFLSFAVVAIGLTAFALAQEDPRGLLTPRTARWEHEVKLEGDEETFGAEHNPTGDPIGGGEGYKDIITKGNYTVRTFEELRNALEKANTGQVVFIPGDVEINMTGQKALSVPAGVTVASTRGREGSKGALLFSDAEGVYGMLVTSGDYVRITGLRIRGPHLEQAPAPDSLGIVTDDFGLEVDNCDVSGFSCAAIFVRPGASRAYVHHNFIHHNQRKGLGYGVLVDEADVLVEANIFDWCRHHICGGNGTPGTGYEARYNICRAHAIGHLFDMHGQASGSGIAGDWMNVHHNTFMCLDMVSIGIRGTPSQGAKIHHNWFYDPDPGKAVFVIASAFGPGTRNWAMRSIGDQSLGNSRAYRNVFGAERRLLKREEIIEARLRFTRGSLRSEGPRLLKTDLMEIIRVQREELDALGASVEKWKRLEARIKKMSKDELIDVILAQLKQIDTLDAPTDEEVKP